MRRRRRSASVAPAISRAEHAGRARRGRRRRRRARWLSAPTERLSRPGVSRATIAALVDDRDPVAELVGLLHVVRREQDRLAVDVELAEDLPQRDAALRVEPGGRLVEEEDRRPVHHRPGDHQPLRHAARQRHAPAPSARSARRNCSSSRVGLGLRRLGVHAEEPAVEVEVLPHVSERSSVLVWGTTPISRLASAGGATTSMPPTQRLPDGRDHAGGEHAGGGRLAGAVRAEQAEDLAALDGEVEAVDREDVARVDLGEAVGAGSPASSALAAAARCAALRSWSSRAPRRLASGRAAPVRLQLARRRRRACRARPA